MLQKLNAAKTTSPPKKQERTVVRIHMRQATLAPMATAPAVPPRTADFAALSMISLNVAGSLFSITLVDMTVVYVFVCCRVE